MRSNPDRLARWFALSLLITFVAHPALAQISPTLSTATSAGGGIHICPEGDGRSLGAEGAAITVTLLDIFGDPVPGIPAADIWLEGSFGGCAPGVLNADGPTDANGVTTISGSISGGDWSTDGLQVRALGMAIGDVQPIVFNSPDMNDDGVVDLADLGKFTALIFDFGNPMQILRCDYNHDGLGNMVDLATFANHYDHECP